MRSSTAVSLTSGIPAIGAAVALEACAVLSGMGSFAVSGLQLLLHITFGRSALSRCGPPAANGGPAAPARLGAVAPAAVSATGLDFGEPELSMPGPGAVLRFSCGERVNLSGAELPLSCGERVTFFAGAKKVTKETPFESEHPQDMRESGRLFDTHFS